MKKSLPKIALLILFSILGTFLGSSAQAARRTYSTVIPIVVITVAKPLTGH